MVPLRFHAVLLFWLLIEFATLLYAVHLIACLNKLKEDLQAPMIIIRQ